MSAPGAGCGPTASPRCLAEAEALAWPGLRHVVVARVDDGVRVRGFSGAVPAGSEVELLANDVLAQATADEQGRFDVSIAVDSDTVMLHVDDETATLRVRELSDALACVGAEALPVGTTPNELELGRCGDALVGLVPTSGDGALEVAALSGPSRAAVAFPLQEGRGSNPWAVAFHEGGELAAVTLFGQHTVALVDPCGGRLLQSARALDDAGEPLLLDVDPPLSLTHPLDADGDGSVEQQVSRMRPLHPEGIAFVGDRLLVSYTNLLEVGPPARFGPGLVVAFALEGETLRAVGHAVLPFQNPQAIALDDEGAPWVSCSGVLERGTASFEAATVGGLVRLDPLTLEHTHVLELGRLAPGTPAIMREGTVVGSVLSPRVAHLPRGATSLADGTLLATGASSDESLFDVVDLGGGLALAASFTTDALLVIDVLEGALHPWPFERPLALRESGELFRGLKAVSLTPARASGGSAPDGAALLALSSELVPLRFWQVMGP